VDENTLPRYLASRKIFRLTFFIPTDSLPHLPLPQLEQMFFLKVGIASLRFSSYT
jgi:hypothetical protein